MRSRWVDLVVRRPEVGAVAVELVSAEPTVAQERGVEVKVSSPLPLVHAPLIHGTSVRDHPLASTCSKPIGRLALLPL